MISTANYVARKYGVRSAMPGFIGKKLCPDLIFVHCHFEKYLIVAEQIRAIIREYDPYFSSHSLDEVYLDLTDAAMERVLNPYKNEEKLRKTKKTENTEVLKNTEKSEINPSSTTNLNLNLNLDLDTVMIMIMMKIIMMIRPPHRTKPHTPHIPPSTTHPPLPLPQIFQT